MLLRKMDYLKLNICTLFFTPKFVSCDALQRHNIDASEKCITTTIECKNHIVVIDVQQKILQMNISV